MSRTPGEPERLAFYLRYAGNLHYFAAIRPYLDHYRRAGRHRLSLVVRERHARFEGSPDYHGYQQLFTSEADLDRYDLVVTPTHLRPGEHPEHAKTVQVFHGLSDKPFTYERDFSGYDLCLCVGRRQVDRLRQAPRNTALASVVVGYPKFDRVPAKRSCPLNRPTVIYCPTWRKGGFSSVERFLNAVPTVEKLARRYNLLVKPHPNIFNPQRALYDPTIVEGLRQLKGVRLVIAGNVLPWLARADVFIGDISATGYEWLYFDRPMVFLNPQPGLLAPSPDFNAPTYLWQCGDVCDDVRDLEQSIEGNLREDRYHHIREILLHYSVQRPRDGGATARGVRELDRLCSVTDARASRAPVGT